MFRSVGQVTTRVQTDDDRSAPIPWWVIVLASCGGVLILLILVLILYKVRTGRWPQLEGRRGKNY